MSRIPLQKLIPLNKSDTKGNQGTITLTNVLQSDQVKRLLNQPNIIVRTLPLTTGGTTTTNNQILTIKKNGLNQKPCSTQKPDISIQAVKNAVSLDDTKRETLLPSKNSGKSEILIRPLYRKRKPCGHFEACESLVCDVKFQNYADESGVTPILARTIGEDEISAPVSKHCTNLSCDALSIDHDKCRRACVSLHRFDVHSCCDICGIMLKTRKFRANHRGCKRKHVYRHNDADCAEILRRKMRERELQILESTKLKKRDYLDPVNGHNKALEILRKNDELIVIPKTKVTNQAPIVTITTIPTSMQQTVNNNNSNSTFTIVNNGATQVVGTKQFTISTSNGGGSVTQTQTQSQAVPQTQMPTIKNVYGNVIGSIPIVIGNQTGVLINTAKQVNTTTVNAVSGAAASVQNPLITVTTMPNQTGQASNTIRPVILSNWIGNNQSQIITTPLQPKPFITPIRVVPIANFKSQPSLLHQVQGMPKFCIMADSPNVQTILQPPPLIRIHSVQTTNNNQTIILPNVSNIAAKKTEKEVSSAPPPPPTEPSSPPTIKIEEDDEEEEQKKEEEEEPKEKEDDDDDDIKLGEGTMLDTIRRRRKKVQNKLLYKKSYIFTEKDKKKTPKVKNFSCPYCSKKLGTEWYFKTHVARHKGETPYVCRICEKEFVNSYEMRKHHANRHTKHEIRCEFCPFIATSEKQLKEHIANEDEANPVKCWACDDSAISCEMLDRHQRLTHGTEICRNCGERMSNVRLKKHLILRHGMTKTRAEEEIDKLMGNPQLHKQAKTETDWDNVVVKEECNGDFDDEITIKEEPEYYDYESYTFEDETLETENETAYETEDTSQMEIVEENYEEEEVDEGEDRLVVDESIEEEIDDDGDDYNLILEEDEEMDPELAEQFEEVIENGDEEMEIEEIEEQFGDDGSLCNACGKMFANKRKYLEHRVYCVNAADTSDEASNSSERATINGDKT